MNVAKWGNSLAVRLPAGLVEALELKVGDSVNLRVAGERDFEVEKTPAREELLARLRKHRGSIPADIKFDRSEIYDRD